MAAEGSAEGSGGSAHGVAKMRKAAKMRIGSKNAQRQRKCAKAAVETAGDSAETAQGSENAP